MTRRRITLTPWAPITGGWILMTGASITAGNYLAATAATLCTLMALLTAHTDHLRITHVHLLEEHSRLLEANIVAQDEIHHLQTLKLARFERSADHHQH